MNRSIQKLNSTRGGINRLVALLLVLVAIMLGVISIPLWKEFKYRSEKTGCVQAMKSASDGLIIEYLYRRDGGSVKDAMATLDEVMVGRPDICPSHGTVYLVRQGNDIYKPVCGLHEDDKKLRVRLNASEAMVRVKETLRKLRLEQDTEPESVTIELNGKDLECVRVQSSLDLRRGTDLTNGYKGIVCFYGLAGDGTFPTTQSTPAGDIYYFVYADEYHCASWLADDGWTGDAYKDE